MEEKVKLKIGQTIWYKSGEPNKPVVEATITKVGKKYINININRNAFFKDSLIEVKNYGYKGQIYLDKQDILDEQEHLKLSNYVRSFVGSYGSCTKLSLQQLREICAIMNQ